MSTRIVIFLCIALLCATKSSDIYAQGNQAGSHVLFFLGEREFHPADNIYSMQVWAYVPPNHRWKVGNSIINIEYNNTALRAINTDDVWDAWPEFKNKAYMLKQVDYGTSTSLTLIILHSNYAVIEGGNEAIHLGTLRWEVLDGSLKDDFYMVTDSNHAQVSIVTDSTFELKPKRLDFNTRWTWRSISSRVIDPESDSAYCRRMYYYQYNCEEGTSATVWNPLQDSALYWHRTMNPTGAGSHVVSYQTDGWNNPPLGPARERNFDWFALDSLFAVVRCKWEKQLVPGDIEYRELQNPTDGGIVKFSVRFEDFGQDFAAAFVAVTLHALHPNDLTKIVAAGDCGLGGVQFGMSTILLNNTIDFYVFSPHFRWTMDYQNCGSSPRCLDLESILTHEFGHYLGIGHQEQPLSLLWAGYDQRNVQMHQCDADAVRRLYSPQLLAQSPVPPPDNSPCIGPTDVQDSPATSVFVGGDLRVYPMPITDNQFSIRTQIERPTRLAFSIIDVLGRTVRQLSDTYQTPGEQNYSFSVDLQPGAYFLKVETDAGVHLEKIVVLR